MHDPSHSEHLAHLRHLAAPCTPLLLYTFNALFTLIILQHPSHPACCKTLCFDYLATLCTSRALCIRQHPAHPLYSASRTRRALCTPHGTANSTPCSALTSHPAFYNCTALNTHLHGCNPVSPRAEARSHHSPVANQLLKLNLCVFHICMAQPLPACLPASCTHAHKHISHTHTHTCQHMSAHVPTQPVWQGGWGARTGVCRCACTTYKTALGCELLSLPSSVSSSCFMKMSKQEAWVFVGQEY